MWCKGSESDDTFDQETYYAYDDAGRRLQDFIQDDGGREAEVLFEWDKNGNNTKVTAPFTFSFETTYGHTNNSDTDRIKNVKHNGRSGATTLSETTSYLPFGPEEHIRHYNEVSSNDIWEYKDFNLAYRPTDLYWIHSTTKVLDIDYSEDRKGRIIERDFTYGASGLEDAHYVYDELDRLLCDATTSGSCPTEGSRLKTTIAGSPAYTASGERNVLHHYHPSWGTVEYDSTLVSGADQIDTIDYIVGRPGSADRGRRRRAHQGRSRVHLRRARQRPHDHGQARSERHVARLDAHVRLRPQESARVQVAVRVRRPDLLR